MDDIDKYVRNQIASAMMEGFEFSETDYKLIQQIVKGEIDLQDVIKKIKNKHKTLDKEEII